MATNPLPADAATAQGQGVNDGSATKLRIRRDDERRAVGEGIEYTKHIICPALGVRLDSNQRYTKRGRVPEGDTQKQ